SYRTPLNNFVQNKVGIQITKKSIDYSTQKLVKWGVYQLRGSFGFDNGPFWSPWTIAYENRQNGRFTCFRACLTFKVGRFGRDGQLAPYLRSPKSRWTIAHENCQNGGLPAPGSTKSLWTIAHENWQNERFTCSGDRLTFKMGCFGPRNSRSPKSPWTIVHENRQNGGFSCSGARLTFKMGRFGHEGPLAP
ncbi:hypothetical protein H5410_044034, partial [Solanum commersonii]